ncbi:MAG: hypothetical protein IPO37_01450 [Saprospiraceae bacterium]|nr:hypothetical protein [Saprospiraceae bacterium]
MKDLKTVSHPSVDQLLKIRKIKDPIYCPLLLDALSTEIHKNTWETQYQIIMAIGETKCHNALEFLYSILNIKLEPMVRLALSDAITRIEQDDSFLINAIELKDKELVEGAIRAIALEHKKLSNSKILKLLNFLESINDTETVFWLAAGAPGWDHSEIKANLIKWAESENYDLSRAAKSALTKNI